MSLTNVCRYLVAGALVLLIAHPIEARGIYPWSYQEVYDRADIVVIARPESSEDTSEVTAITVPIGTFHVVGVNTTFHVKLVLKGDKGLKSLVLHHFRDADTNDARPEGPFLVAFGEAAMNSRFILFLTRESDGRYAPVTGQTDAHMSVIYIADSLVDPDDFLLPRKHDSNVGSSP